MKYAILSDIHANLEALNAALDLCKVQGVETYLCLGDVVGYNANPRECLQIVRELPGLSIVKGNHDEYASNNDDLMEGFNSNAREAVLWTKTQLSEEDRSYLSTLPMRQVVKGSSITLVHATLDEPAAWGYIFDPFRAKDNFEYQTTMLCFCGHSHVPMTFCKYPVTKRIDGREIGDIPEWMGKPGEELIPEITDQADSLEIKLERGFKYLVNVGSVGQPRNRDPRCSFAIYDSEAGTLVRHRLPYDIAAAQAKIREAGLPERNYLRLETGN